MKLELDQKGPDLAGQDRRRDWTNEQREGTGKDGMEGSHRMEHL